MTSGWKRVNEVKQERVKLCVSVLELDSFVDVNLTITLNSSFCESCALISIHSPGNQVEVIVIFFEVLRITKHCRTAFFHRV